MMWMMAGWIPVWAQAEPTEPRHQRIPEIVDSAQSLEAMRERYEALLREQQSDKANLQAQLDAQRTGPFPAPPAPVDGPVSPVRPVPAPRPETDLTALPPPLDADAFAEAPPPPAREFSGQPTPTRLRRGDQVAPDYPPPVAGITQVVAPRPIQVPMGPGKPFVVAGSPRPTKRGRIPAGSYVLGTVLSGVEAGTRGDLPLVVQLERAFTMPNYHRMRAIGPRTNGAHPKPLYTFSGCMVIASVRGNLATERLDGEVRSLSCTTDAGEDLFLPVKGFLVGQDNTFGIRGQIFRRDGAAMGAAILASLGQGLTSALARSRETTQIIPGLVGGTTATNVQDPLLFALGTGGASASRRLADWYLERASALEPVVAVGSGFPVWIMLLEPAQLPEGTWRVP